MLRRGRRGLEFALVATFLLGPMVYALTLPRTEPHQCEAPVELVEIEVAAECSEPKAEPALEPKPKAEPKPEREFMFLVGEGNYVVLDDSADASWSQGELLEPEGVAEGETWAAKSVALDRVPALHQAQIGRTIDTYGSSGKRCSATIERLLVVSAFGEGLEGLRLDDWDDELQVPVEFSPGQVREAVWATQPGWLVGVLDHDCEGLWARDAMLPAPQILTLSRAENPTTRARLAQFERSGELAELRVEYEAYRAETEDPEELGLDAWPLRMAKQTPQISTWLDATGVAHFLEFEYGFDDTDPCTSDGYDTSIASFESIQGGAFEVIGRGGPMTIFDADLDGRFELLFDSTGDDQRAWAASLDSESPDLSMALVIDEDRGGCRC